MKGFEFYGVTLRGFRFEQCTFIRSALIDCMLVDCDPGHDTVFVNTPMDGRTYDAFMTDKQRAEIFKYNCRHRLALVSERSPNAERA